MMLTVCWWSWAFGFRFRLLEERIGAAEGGQAFVFVSIFGWSWAACRLDSDLFLL